MSADQEVSCSTLAPGASCSAAFSEDARLAALDRYDVLDTPREEKFDRITRLAQLIFGTPIVLVSLLDAHRQWFKSRQGLDITETAREPAFCNVTLQRRATLVVPDTTSSAEFANNPLVTGAPHIRFYAGAPLWTPDGQIIGTLCVIDRVPRVFEAAQVEILTGLAKIVVDELELRRLADVDSMTGALSRRAFREEVERNLDLASRHRYPLSLVAFDLDRFKSINDTYGHPTGDAVLTRSVAACARELRKSDVIGRLGGEEFAIMLPHAPGAAALLVAERLRAAIAAELYPAAAGSFSVTASFGIAAHGGRRFDIDALFARADEALYRAKSSGRDRCILAIDDVEPPTPKRRMLKSGRILIDARRSSIRCTVRSMSERGAELGVAALDDIPEAFELSTDADGVVRQCRRVSTKRRRLEVEFG